MADQQNTPPADPGNSLLCERPAQLTVVRLPTPLGERLLLTIRTETTTLTILLSKADAGNWIGLLRDTAEPMTDLMVAPGPLPEGFKMPLDHLNGSGL